jgi:hypothetical protein
MRTKLIQSLLASVLAAGACSSLQAQLSLLNNFSANQGSGFSAGEIVAFDPNTDRLFVTSSGLNLTQTVLGDNSTTVISSGIHQVNIFGISNTGSKTDLGTIDFSSTFGSSANMRGLSSVAVDPLGRFGVVGLIPTTNTTTLGKIGFFNLSTGAVIGTSNVGYHPDSITFSADGSRLIVVNEGELNTNTSADDRPMVGTNPGNVNAPGSISILDVSGINAGNLATLTSLGVTTKDFSAGNLAPGVSIDTLRNNNHPDIGTSGTFIGSVPVFNTAAPEAIEPEYATVKGDKVYVSLQDNNAVAEYDLVSGLWTEIKDLGTITQTIDASDQGLPVINISQVVKGLPMPDTIATYEVGGKTYVVTANEGDARVDDRDISRFGDTGGSDDMDPILDTNYPAGQTGVRANTELGRLNVSRLSGDTDNDGKIDEINMHGTRSFSIYEDTAGGLVRVFDSGDTEATNLENIVEDFGGWLDSRSDDKGPEPEGLTIGEINGRQYLFIGMERTAHIFQFDITNPLGVTFVDGELVPGAARPEGFQFVSAADSPTGQALLMVGFEGDGTLSTTEQVAIFTVIPEPSSYAAIAGGLLFGFAAMRRRRARA